MKVTVKCFVKLERFEKKLTRNSEILVDVMNIQILWDETEAVLGHC